jgi:ABC-type nitrate/sulfonate/bicarbonate transport system substrate-binding protein/outer membrane protein OmpA-like peptidoglycan-associated protein
MKRFIIGVAILAVVIGGAVAYKMLIPRTSGGGGPLAGITESSGGLTYAKATPLTAPPVGGFQLPTVDLGDGPVPLLTVPLDTWGGYAALFAANRGLSPSKDSLFYKKGHFAVQLVHVESSTDQLAGYSAGQYPLIWASMDSLPLLYDALKADKRVAPKVLGLFDWSAGGDGILAKSWVKTPADLKGKIILTSSNTPYAFFLLWYLAQNGLTGNDVKVVWDDDGAKALKLFKQDKRIAAWVSWTPYINDCLDPKSPSYVPDTRLMISSKDANQLIADCYIVRADFLQEKPKMAQAFVEAMMEASQEISAKTYSDMAGFYKLASAGDAKSMLDDVHVANFPENKMFFDEANTIGTYKIFILAQEYYKQLGVIPQGSTYEADQVLAPQFLAAIDKEGLFKDQKNTMLNSFNTKSSLDLSDLESSKVVLTDNVEMYFDPNQSTFDINSDRAEFKQDMTLLDKVAEQTKFLSTTAIELVGNSDTSMQAAFKAKGPQGYADGAAQVTILSKHRAEFIRSLLIDHYGLPANRVLATGVGWDNPLDPNDQAKNRRVDVKFISLQQGN